MAASPLRARAILADLPFSAGADTSAILPGGSSFLAFVVVAVLFGGVFFLTSTVAAGSTAALSSFLRGHSTAALSTLSCGVRFVLGGVFFLTAAGSTAALSTLSRGVRFFGRCLYWLFACSFLLAGSCFGPSQSSRSFPSAGLPSLVLAGVRSCAGDAAAALMGRRLVWPSWPTPTLLGGSRMQSYKTTFPASGLVLQIGSCGRGYTTRATPPGEWLGAGLKRVSRDCS